VLKNAGRILFTLLISITTFGLLFGAFFFYQEKFINKPLTTFLDNSQFINEYQVLTRENSSFLILQLQNTDDLADEFQSFLKESGEILSKEDFTLEIYSNPSQNLLDFYQEIQPAIYEALTLGNFTELQDRLTAKQKEYKLKEVKLTINQDFLFLQLEDQDNYLYHIYNRSEQVVPKVINHLGSDIK